MSRREKKTNARVSYVNQVVFSQFSAQFAFIHTAVRTSHVDDWVLHFRCLHQTRRRRRQVNMISCTN